MTEIEITEATECGECMGSGEVGSDDDACLHCHGTGVDPEAAQWQEPGHGFWKRCPVCASAEPAPSPGRTTADEPR